MVKPWPAHYSETRTSVYVVATSILRAAMMPRRQTEHTSTHIFSIQGILGLNKLSNWLCKMLMACCVVSWSSRQAMTSSVSSSSSSRAAWAAAHSFPPSGLVLFNWLSCGSKLDQAFPVLTLVINCVCWLGSVWAIKKNMLGVSGTNLDLTKQWLSWPMKHALRIKSRRTVRVLKLKHNSTHSYEFMTVDLPLSLMPYCQHVHMLTKITPACFCLVI